MCEGILKSSLIKRMDTSFRDIYKLNIKTKNSFPNTSVLCLTPYTIWQFLKSASIFWYCWTETNALRAQKNCSKSNLRPRKTSSHTKMMATLNAHQPIEFIAAVPLHSLPSFLSLSQLKHILCLKSGDWLSFCSLPLNKIQQQSEKGPWHTGEDISFMLAIFFLQEKIINAFSMPFSVVQRFILSLWKSLFHLKIIVISSTISFNTVLLGEILLNLYNKSF